MRSHRSLRAVALLWFTVLVGTLPLKLRAQAANDAFASPTLLPSTQTGSIAGTSQNTSGEVGEPAHYVNQPARRSVWYQWTAPSNGSVTFHTTGSDFDTLLAAYSGNTFPTLRQLGSNDDANNSVQSQIAFSVIAGTAYRIAVDGFGGNFGSIRLSWTLTGPPILLQPPTSATAVEGGFALLRVQVDSAFPVSYLWYRNADEIPGGRTNLLSYGPVTLADEGPLFRVTAANRYGSITSAPVTLTVLRDVTPPTITGAFNAGRTNLSVGFSEPIEPGSVAVGIFSLDGGVTVLGASTNSDGRSLRLHVSPLTFEEVYTVTITGITDAAGRPNPIAPGSQVQFTASELSIANVGTTGSAGTLTRPAPFAWALSGTGSGISGGLDQFQFASGERTGDFDIQVRLHSVAVTAPHLQAGLMARVDGSPGVPFAGVFASTPQLGSFFESRNNLGVNTVTASVPGDFPSALPDGWLRLRRQGSVFTGFASIDGRTWVRLGSVDMTASGLPFPASLQVGLALSAEAAGRTANAVFREFRNTVSTVESDRLATDFREPLGPASRRTGLIFSEIMYADGPFGGTNSVEFIELYNAGSIFEDLSGWSLDGEVRFTFPAGSRLEAGAFLVLAGDPASFQQVHGFQPAGRFEGRLNGSGGTLRWKDENRAVRLELDYSNREPWPVAAAGTGHSLVLSRPSYGVADPRAWSASARFGGSPGRDDPWSRPALAAVRIDEVLARPGPGANAFVELHNTGSDEVDLGGAVLTDDPRVSRFTFPANTRIPSHGRLTVDRSTLGFDLSANGGLLLLRDRSSNVVDALRHRPQAVGVAFGRPSDGALPLRPLATPTPGGINAGPRPGRVVLNEVMYRPLSGEEGDQFVELHNPGTNRVEVGGWGFVDGISLTLPVGTVIEPGGFLVAAKDRARLLQSHPGLPPEKVVGNWNGKLSGSGERLALSRPERMTLPLPGGGTTNDTVWIEEDAMVWSDGGRWPELADGGGSSLERLDPAADPFLAPTWAASDERAKAGWATFEVTGPLDHGNSAYGFNQVQITLQGPGECLIDQVEVLRGGTSFLTNGGFEAGILPGAAGWVVQGNHSASVVEEGAPWSGRRALRVTAPARGDTGINRIRGLLQRGLAEGDTVTLRARARWLAGWPEALVRLRGNWLELPIRMEVPRNLGTPGRTNSRRQPNAGPAIFEVSHSPILPAVGDAARVTARVSDPDGIGAVVLRFRSDPSTNLTQVPMHDDGLDGDREAGDGLWTAALPARFTPGVVAFRVEARDSRQAGTVFPANAPVGEALIRWGDPKPVGTFGHTHLWNVQANQAARGSQLNNTYRDCTLVHNGVRVVYNAGFKDKGSPFHAGGGDFVVVAPQDDRLLGSDSMVFASTGNGDNESTQQKEQMSFWIGRKLGVPWLHRRYVRLYRNGGLTRNLLEDSEEPDGEFTEYWFGETGNGELFKIEDWFEFDDSGTGFSNTDARLEEYITSNGAYKTARYRWSWRKRAVDRSANDYSSLFQLVSVASAGDGMNRLSTLIDGDNWMRVMALERICGNWDSFGMSRGKNMYAYKPAAGTWKLLPWDIDFTLGSGNGPDDGLYGGDDPAVNQMFSTPSFQRRLYQGYRLAVNGPLDAAQFEPQLGARADILRANGITPASNRPIADYLNRRRTRIQSELNSLDIPSLTLTGATNRVQDTATTVLSATAPLAAETILVNGVPVEPEWSSAVGFTLLVPLPVRTNRFEISALDAAGNPVGGPPLRLQVVRPSAPASVPGSVRINEIVASNQGATTDPADQSVNEDWFELYNAGSTPVDLSGWRLSDRTNFVNAFLIPAGTVLPARGFLLVWADDEVAQNRPGGDLHVAFKLSADGERIVLFDPLGTVVDQVGFGAQSPNFAFGSYPDGSTNRQTLRASTPRSPNSGVGAPNRPPAFPQLGARTLVAGQQLDLFVVSSDPDSDRVTLSLGADAPTGARIEDGAFLRWTPTTADTGTNVFHLRLTDAGIPSLAVEQSIQVTVLAPRSPSLTTVSDGGPLRLRWTGQNGVRYRIESSENLATGAWSLLEEVVGNGSALEFTPTAEASARWFRVVIR